MLGSWYPVILFTAFNLSDLVGKSLPFFGWRPSQRMLLCLSLSRIVFVPAFLLVGMFNAPEAVVVLLTFALGLTSG